MANIEMEVLPPPPAKMGVLSRGRQRLRSLPTEFANKVAEMARNVRKLGQDDPRRVTHSLKVGLALTLVSLIYYYQPLYINFEDTALWAVMTVVVVFEFSVGATLSKGLNRAIATLLAGALAVGAHHLANMSGKTAKPVLLGLFVFLQATTSTFMRFFPKIKARYDYGLLIFILTFSLISLSGFREEELLEMAHKRLSTIFIGGAACVIISICVCPVWAGEDLHQLIALNMEKLGNFLEGFSGEYFKKSVDGESDTKEGQSLQGYRSVLGSKSTEESLANFARWEPGHGKFQFRHPWQQYLKLGTLIRQCAYRIESLDGYLNAAAKTSPQVRDQIEETCKEISLEAGTALKELAVAVRTMTRRWTSDSHIENSRNAVKKLEALLKTSMWKNEDVLATLPASTVASLLIDVVECTEKVGAAVHELAALANFKEIHKTAVSPEKLPSARIGPKCVEDCPHIVLTIVEQPVLPENSSTSDAAPASVPVNRSVNTNNKENGT